MKRKGVMETVSEEERVAELLLGSYGKVELQQAKTGSSFVFDFALLCVLYCFQGVPLGLAGGAIPFLMKSLGSSYSKIGLFSLALLPFSLKLCWAPVVDGSWMPGLGRRKSWIIPCQVFAGLLMMVSSFMADEWVGDGSMLLVLLFFVLVLAFATQDIAVDGWALELMADNLPYASTAQSVGQNIGYFTGFTVFLGAHSLGWISLGQFMWIWGILFLACSGLLWQMVPEAPPSPQLRVDSVRSVYGQLFQIARLPDVRRFVLFLMTCGVGFTAHDKALHLRLIEAGFSKELLASLGLASLPLSVGFAVVTGRWARNGRPLTGPFLVGNVLKLVTAVLGMLLLWMCPDKSVGSPSKFFVFCLFVVFCLGTLASSLLFVSLSAFFNEISPKSIGGTYLTMLNTISNLGKVNVYVGGNLVFDPLNLKAWAGPFVLSAIDFFGFGTVGRHGVFGNQQRLVQAPLEDIF